MIKQSPIIQYLLQNLNAADFWSLKVAFYLTKLGKIFFLLGFFKYGSKCIL